MKKLIWIFMWWWGMAVVLCSVANAQNAVSVFYKVAAAVAPSQVTLIDSSSTFTASGSSISWTHTVSTGSNRILVVLSGNHDLLAVDSVRYGTSRLRVIPINNDSTWMCMFYLLDPPAGSNTVYLYGAGASRWQGAALTFKDVSQTTPFGTYVEKQWDGGASDSVLVSCAIGDYLVSSSWKQDATITPNNGQWVTVSIYDGSLNRFMVGSFIATATSHYQGWTWGSSNYAGLNGIAVKPN